jgi:hypothetical protein
MISMSQGHIPRLEHVIEEDLNFRVTRPIALEGLTAAEAHSAHEECRTNTCHGSLCRF